MTEIDRTELHELRERVQGAAADREIIAEQLRTTLARNRELETQLQQMTQHRDRLLGEKELIWASATAPDRASALTHVARDITTDEGQES